MVEQVEELGSELNLVSFTYLEAFLQNEIHIDKLRASQVANPRVTEHVRDLLSGGQRRCGKHGLVVPARQRLVTWNTTEVRLFSLPNGETVRIPNLIRPITAATGIAEIAGHDGRKCLPALRARYATDLPSTNNSIGNTP